MSNPLNTLQQQYRKYRMYLLVILALLIGALAVSFFYRPLVIILLAAAVAFQLFVLRPLQKQYSDSVTCENLLLTTCKVLGSDEVQKQGGYRITPETIRRAGLMPCGDEKNLPLFRWELHGEKKGISIALCDATIPQHFKLAENGKNRVHFDSGVWVHIDLPADTQLHIRLLDETSVPTPIRMQFFSEKWNYETASIPDADIAKRMVLYRPQNTQQQPSDSLLLKLKALMEYTPGYVALSINNSQMDIFIRGRFLSRAVSVSQKPSEQLLNFEPFPELSYIIDLARSVSR